MRTHKMEIVCFAMQLVKSEMYKWLNRYLVLGKLPSNFTFDAPESSEVRSLRAHACHLLKQASPS